MFGRRFYPPDADLSDNGFIANEPEGLFTALKWALQFKKPIIITENGVEDGDDHLRPRYLLQHLHQLWRGVNFNWPVKGYFHWTLVDNYEWERGWTQRFGLWELDTETQARRKRPSADLYAQICRENCISSDMVSHYAPEIYAQMFPE
jgi:beta-glucosidase